MSRHPTFSQRTTIYRGVKVRARIRRCLRLVRRHLGDSPHFLPLVLRATPLGTSRRLRHDTTVVVEGFPRSGNTFAAFALREMLAHTPNSHVASHVHTPSQVRRAVAMRLPVLIVIREPDEAVCSLLVAAPHVRPLTAYREWVHHYGQLLPLSSHFEVAGLADLIDRLPVIVTRLNQRFGCEIPATWTPEMKFRTQTAMEANHNAIHDGAQNTAPWPSEHRTVVRDTIRASLGDPALTKIRAQAHQLYETFASLIDRSID